jgi:hypothetical protein
MKIRTVCLRLCMAGGILALMIACSTPPRAAPSATAEAAPTAIPSPSPAVAPGMANAAAPDDLRAQAAALRKRAFDLGLKDVLADDYAAAETAYSAGAAAYGVDNAASAASFEDAKVKFGGIIREGLPLLAAAEKDRAARLRDTAIQKSAVDLFPDLLAFADADFAKSAASESSGDYEAALADYRASTLEYEALYKLCDAWSARSFLVSQDLAKWDPSNWTLAEGKYSSSQGLYRQDAHASVDAVDEAILRYGVVRNTAYGYYAADRRKASETERDHADSIKSDVAVKEAYAAALALYGKAQADEGAKDFEASSEEYDGAASAFAAAYTQAKAKMDVARDELDSLDSALSAAEMAQGR